MSSRLGVSQRAPEASNSMFTQSFRKVLMRLAMPSLLLILGVLIFWVFYADRVRASQSSTKPALQQQTATDEQAKGAKPQENFTSAIRRGQRSR